MPKIHISTSISGIFFYRLDHFDKAQSFYRLAIVIARKIEHPHAEATALQHIGLAWQEMQQTDSAFYYFNTSGSFSYETGYLTRALSFQYLAELCLELKPRNCTMDYQDSAFKLIDKFRATPPETLGSVYHELLVASQMMECSLYKVLYDNCLAAGTRDQAEAFMEKSLIVARDVGANSLLAELFLEKALHSDSSVKPELVEMFADSVFIAADRLQDPVV